MHLWNLLFCLCFCSNFLRLEAQLVPLTISREGVNATWQEAVFKCYDAYKVISL